jgi:hypothetical protein
MKFFTSLLFALFSSLALAGSKHPELKEEFCAVQKTLKSQTCIHFSVGSGTGCAYMCQYCADQLGTNNYYFTDGVCTYQTGGCQGNPLVGVTYTCCAN